MTTTKRTDIALGQAQKKYSRLKTEVDGTAKAEKAYQKAKTVLAMARQAHAEQRSTYVKPGDGAATVTAVAVKAKTRSTR